MQALLIRYRVGTGTIQKTGSVVHAVTLPDLVQQHIPQQPGGDILVPVNSVGVYTFDLGRGRR